MKNVSTQTTTPEQERHSKRPDFHQSYFPLFVASKLSKHQVAIIPIPTIWPPNVVFFPPLVKRIWEMFFSFLTHIRLVREVWRQERADMVIVREFLNLPTVLVWPLLWPLRHKVIFLVNHNIQFAHISRLEGLALQILCRSGLRLLCLELPAGLAELGLRGAAEASVKLPFPLNVPVSKLMTAQAPESGRKRVGVVGNFRREKNADTLLEVLLQGMQQGILDADIVLGCPDQRYRSIWEGRGVLCYDTSNYEDYLDVLSSCNVVVLNYSRDAYYFRHSGVIADAISNDVAVVCPDFPLLASQISVPEVVGFTFQSVNDIPRQVSNALAFFDEWRSQGVFEKHRNARSAASLASMLEKYL